MPNLQEGVSSMRLAELMAALSLATDLGMGQPLEYALCSCVLATRLGSGPSRDSMQKAARKVELGSAGLPVGVQVVARHWREHVALAAMRVIEEAASKHEDYPGIAALA